MSSMILWKGSKFESSAFSLLLNYAELLYLKISSICFNLFQLKLPIKKGLENFALKFSFNQAACHEQRPEFRVNPAIVALNSRAKRDSSSPPIKKKQQIIQSTQSKVKHF